jgi:hypothetical protein
LDVEPKTSWLCPTANHRDRSFPPAALFRMQHV